MKKSIWIFWFKLGSINCLGKYNELRSRVSKEQDIGEILQLIVATKRATCGLLKYNVRREKIYFLKYNMFPIAICKKYSDWVQTSAINVIYLIGQLNKRNGW